MHYTPHYLYAPTVPFDVASFYPHAPTLRFLAMLREPVSRAVSSYWFKQPGQAGGSAGGFKVSVRNEIARWKGYEQCLNSTLPVGAAPRAHTNGQAVAWFHFLPCPSPTAARHDAHSQSDITHTVGGRPRAA